MDKTQAMERIVQMEWPMFSTVNGDDRVDCQNNQEMFSAMRKAQFSAWSLEALECYLLDVKMAQDAGRNLVREKYIWMMERTDHPGFEKLKDGLPVISPEKEALIEQIWAEFMEQTERMRKRYPVLALGGRPMNTADETGDITSIETYQKGELKTYSMDTLRALLAHVEDLKAQGVDLVYQIQENSILCLGYASMEEAEAAVARQISFQANDEGCYCCF